MADKPASLLTNTYRAMLGNNETPSHEGRARRRMCERVYTGLRDDGALLIEMSGDDRRKIARKWEKDPSDREIDEFLGKVLTAEEVLDVSAEETERGYFRRGIENLLAFLFLMVDEGNVGNFDKILENALEEAARRSDRTLQNFELTLEMGGTHVLMPDEIAERAREGDGELTLSELRFAYKKGALDRDDLRELGFARLILNEEDS